MFTGIITHIGKVLQVDRSDDGLRLKIGVDFKASEIAQGASIAHDGVCLTVVSTFEDAYEVEVSNETLHLTNMSGLVVGDFLNLERALKVGDELGGHMVLGHVDGLCQLLGIERDGDSHRLQLTAPTPLNRFIARKGSIALNGISLTVNEVLGNEFGVNIIPHSWKYTTLSRLNIGDKLNLEVDPLARYAARWQETNT